MSRLTFRSGIRRARDAREFGKVAVLLGGDFGARNLAALRQCGARGAACGAASMP